MPTRTARHQSVSSITRLNAEWRSLGRSPAAVAALRRLSAADATVAALAGEDVGDGPARCRCLFDLVEFLRAARGRIQREEAARLVQVLLREAKVDPLVPRTLVQALLPGLITVAGRLQWGRGGDWVDGDEFFAELLSTTWSTIDEWAGQDRPYAVLDLLSAVRCRLRRQLLKAKEHRLRLQPLSPAVASTIDAPNETDLEALSRLLIQLKADGMRLDEVQVLYAHHVLGYSISELAAVTGRDRRALYARRDRGQRRLCA